jgi:hypothetical protein
MHRHEVWVCCTVNVITSQEEKAAWHPEVEQLHMHVCILEGHYRAQLHREGSCLRRGSFRYLQNSQSLTILCSHFPVTYLSNSSTTVSSHGLQYWLHVLLSHTSHISLCARACVFVCGWVGVGCGCVFCVVGCVTPLAGSVGVHLHCARQVHVSVPVAPIHTSTLRGRELASTATSC